jgi:outer membrane protein, heavy metal efflux system
MKPQAVPFALALLLSQTVAARGQLVGLADDIVMMSKGMSERDDIHKETELGNAPGSTGALFRHDPGGRRNSLEDAAAPVHRRPRIGGGKPSVLSAAARSGSTARRAHPTPHSQRLAMRPSSAIQHRTPPRYGLLELPSGEFEGPPHGMTLDQAIERLMVASPDLLAKRYEIPQARADVLTSSLRANPLYFLSASELPYRPYTPGRFGAVQYAPSIVQPFDINDKRGARMEAASQTVRVLEAQYQNAVRLAVDELYLVYTDVLAARETIRYAEANLTGAKSFFEASRAQVSGQAALSEAERLNLEIQCETARLEVDQARSELQRAKHRLGALLALPRQQAARIELRDRIRPPEVPLPGRDDLEQMALDSRPDVQAFRQGIDRAQADAHVARKERIDDVFIVYSPFEYRNNVPIGKQNVSSFSLGLMGSIPLFNRNQGEIRRADTNVAQTRAGLAAIELEAAAEVETAFEEYHASRQAVRRIETAILPASERTRTLAYQKRQAGHASAAEYLLALRERNEVVRQYRETLLRRRRSMLHLNTAVGRRLLP